jgi:G:T-mismatch repair DNA endonuclease (very short patch repair protein)
MRLDEKSPLSHLVRNAAAARDVRVLANLRSHDLRVFVAWECHLKDSIDKVLNRLEALIEVTEA